MFLTVMVLFAISFGTLAIFYYWKPKLLFLSLPIALGIDAFVFWDAFSYYEGRLPMILGTIVQLSVQAVMAWSIKTSVAKKSH